MAKVIKIVEVGHLRRQIQDDDVLKKQDQIFSDREERILKEFKDIQTREELESKVINMITLTRIWFNEVRLSTVKIAQERSNMIKDEVHEDVLNLRDDTQDESACLLIRASRTLLICRITVKSLQRIGGKTK